MHFDVFNGDADGILALVQLQLVEPKTSTLITGVKRDIALLQQVDIQQATSVRALDISMAKNTEALQQLLAHNIAVFYVDHHQTGDIPQSNKLTTLVNTDANICTSLLVNQYLKGKQPLWAIAAAFGDNLKASAINLAKTLHLAPQFVEQLEQLGTFINYNGYGRAIEDLHFHPINIVEQLLDVGKPELLFTNKQSLFYQLEYAYHTDLAKVTQAETLINNAKCAVYLLPDTAWSRRVSGVWGNNLAYQSPDKAHAVLTYNADGSYLVSVRAPINNRKGADYVCSQFLTGGGRAAAAGINQLPQEQVKEFIEKLASFYL